MARPTQFDRRVRRLLLPYGVGLVVLVVLPALLSFVLAFFRYDGLSPPRFAGTLNFRLAFTDDLFILSIANSLALVILPVPLRVFGAFLLAWLAPVLLLLAARDAVLLLPESYTFARLLTEGGPYYATFTLTQFIYELAFDRLDFGQASAALWVLYALTGLLLVVVYVVARQWNVGTSEEDFLL